MCIKHLESMITTLCYTVWVTIGDYHCVFQLCHSVQSAVSLNFWGSYALLCRSLTDQDSYTVHAGCMSPVLNVSSEIQRFECSDVIKICDEIMFIL